MSSKLAKREQLIGSGPVRYRVQTDERGVQSVLVAVDYSNAQIPPHYYVADYFEVTNLDPTIVFTFGKLDLPRADALRNKLEIYFPSLTFIAQLWRSCGPFHKTLRAWVQEFDYALVRPGAILTPVEKIQTMHSNNALMILSGGECMIDFFYISPRDMALKAPKSETINLEPLVRVITSPNLLLGLLDACEPIAEAVTPKYRHSLLEENHAIVES